MSVSQLPDAPQETEIVPEQFQKSLNLFSSMLAASLSQLTCSLHEFCDGSCSSGHPITFKPLAIGTQAFKLVKQTEPSPYPLSHAPSEPVLSLFIQAFPPFSYSHINSTDSYIRLLRVRPAKYLNDPVIVEMVEVCLDQSPEFAALSYHWGPPVFDHAIICNGHKLQVTASLHSALRRHRQDRKKAVELIWADAVCINQSDVLEKSNQVLLMPKIYESAKKVIVWLGASEPSSKFSFEYLAAMAKYILKGDRGVSRKLSAYILASAAHTIAASCLSLIKRPLFRRAWVIQARRAAIQ